MGVTAKFKKLVLILAYFLKDLEIMLRISGIFKMAISRLELFNWS